MSCFKSCFTLAGTLAVAGLLLRTGHAVMPCPHDCGNNGNCDQTTGFCECEFGWMGPGCMEDRVTACRTTGIPLVDIFLDASRLFTYIEQKTTEARWIGPLTCECVAQIFVVLQMKYPLTYLCIKVPAERQSDVIARPSDFASAWAKIPMSNLPKPRPLAATDTEAAAYPVPRLRPLHSCPNSCDGLGWCQSPRAGSSAPSCKCFADTAVGSASGGCQPRAHVDKICPGNCGKHGKCMHHFCRCETGHWGIDCRVTLGADGAAVIADQREEEAVGNVKIWVYNTLPQYRMYLWFSSMDFVARMLRSANRVADPRDANYFWVPVSVDVMQERVGLEMLRWIRDTFPYMRESMAARYPNHLMVLTRDFGFGSSWYRPQHLDRNVNATYLPPEHNPAHPDCALIQMSYHNLRDGLDSGMPKCSVCMSRGRDILIPPAQTQVDGVGNSYKPDAILKYSPFAPGNDFNRERPILFFFAGRISAASMGLDLNDATGRAPVYKRHKGRDRFLLVNSEQKQDGVVRIPKTMANSTFCYIPYGWYKGGYAGRYVSAVLFGCIPVFYQPLRGVKIAYAFEELDEFSWSNASIVVHKADIASLHVRLAAMPLERIHSMQDELRKIYARMMYSSMFQKYMGESGTHDAWNAILTVLDQRLNRFKRGERIRDIPERGAVG